MGTELNEFQGNVVPPSLKWIATKRRPESSAASARYLHRCVQRILFFIAAKSSTPRFTAQLAKPSFVREYLFQHGQRKATKRMNFTALNENPDRCTFRKQHIYCSCRRDSCMTPLTYSRQVGRRSNGEEEGCDSGKKDHLKISFLYVRSRKLLSDRTANEYVYVHGLRYITVACVRLAVLHVCVCAPVCTRVLVCVCGHIPRCVLLCSLAGLFRRQLITTIRSVFLLRHHRKPCMQQCQR